MKGGSRDISSKGAGAQLLELPDHEQLEGALCDHVIYGRAVLYSPRMVYTVLSLLLVMFD